jgi:5-methylthioadenosine/S-adenosylhomocysteine deaminase
MTSLHILGARALVMDEGMTLIDDAALVATGDRLTYVGPCSGAPPVLPGDETLDARGLVALPGLINAHTHLGMTLFRGAADDLPLMTWLTERIWPVEARLTPEDVYWAVQLGIAESLRAGVTTFVDMYWHLEATADAVRESGIRAGLSGVVIPTKGDPTCVTREAIDRVKTLLAEGHPRIKPYFGPHAPYTVPPAMMAQVAELAGELGVSIHTHLSETAGDVERSLAEHGMTPIALMAQVGLFNAPVVAAHCVHLHGDDIRILAEHHVGVAHCPSSNMKLASGRAPMPDLLAAGVTVGLGTDGAGSNNTLDVLREVRSAALLHKLDGDPTAVPAAQALAMATREGAKAIGWPELGTLEVGKQADVVLFDPSAPHLCPDGGRLVSHLAYAAYASDVDTVVVAGKVLMRGRRLLTIDIERVKAKVAESAARLFAA